MAKNSLKVRKDGGITLPATLREQYGLAPGRNLTLIDLGGVFVLSPRRGQVDRLADVLACELRARGETLESMLRAAREERERWGTAEGAPPTS